MFQTTNQIEMNDTFESIDGNLGAKLQACSQTPRHVWRVDWVDSKLWKHDVTRPDIFVIAMIYLYYSFIFYNYGLE